MNIQLSENGNYLSEMFLSQDQPVQTDPMEDYFFVPAGLLDNPKDMWVREDYFDELSFEEWNIVYDILEPYQPGMSEFEQMSGLFGFLKPNPEKKAQRQANRQRRKEAKLAKKEAKVEKKLAKGELIRAKAEGQRTGGTWVDKLSGAVSGIFGGDQETIDTKGLELAINGKDKEEEKKEFPMWGYFAIGGGALLLVYLASTQLKTKKK